MAALRWLGSNVRWWASCRGLRVWCDCGKTWQPASFLWLHNSGLRCDNNYRRKHTSCHLPRSFLEISVEDKWNVKLSLGQIKDQYEDILGMEIQLRTLLTSEVDRDAWLSNHLARFIPEERDSDIQRLEPVHDMTSTYTWQRIAVQAVDKHWIY
jgi:hypothetical protein